MSLRVRERYTNSLYWFTLRERYVNSLYTNMDNSTRFITKIQCHLSCIHDLLPFNYLGGPIFVVAPILISLLIVLMCINGLFLFLSKLRSGAKISFGLVTL